MKKFKLNENGSVLFTVICLMTVLSVVLMTAIITVASSNKKSVTNYTDQQAYVTAKSTVDTFVASLAVVDNNSYDDLRKILKEMPYGKEIHDISVTLPDGKTGKLAVKRENDSEFTITAEVEYMDSKSKVSCKLKYIPSKSYSSDIDTMATNLSYLLPNYLSAGDYFNPNSTLSNYSQRGGSAIGPSPVKLASEGSNKPGTWRKALNKGLDKEGISGNKRTVIVNSQFLWEDTGSEGYWNDEFANHYWPPKGYSFPRDTYKGELVKFEYNVFIPDTIDHSGLGCYCAADDAYIAFMNDKFIGSNNVVRLNDDGTYNKNKIKGWLPDCFNDGSNNSVVIENNLQQILAVFGDLDGNTSSYPYITYDMNAIGNGGKILNLDEDDINFNGMNKLTIYVVNGYNPDSNFHWEYYGYNPAFVCYAFLLNDTALGNYSLTSPESWIIEEYIN